MTTLKKIWKFIGSMRFAILLLVVLAAACAAGSLVTQGQSYDWYARQYSERAAALIVALRLDDAFHSAWFIVVTAFLCLNLTLCNLTRLPRLIRRTRAEGRPEGALEAADDVSREGVADPAAAFARLRMPKPVACHTKDGREALFSSKHRAGLWGAWVCHLGILLLILGFGLGQTTQRQYTVYGVPGQTKPVGDTPCFVTIDGFTVQRREDGSVSQYITDITVVNTASSGPSGGKATLSVNHPATLCGMKFYQNSTGWAARAEVFLDGEPLQQEVLCAGETLAVKGREGLVILLNALYPDYVVRDGVPATASDAPNNPAYLYSVYYRDQLVGMNALTEGQEITVDACTIRFSDPQPYTLIQVKRDPFTPLALVGGLVTLLGLVLAFCLQPARVWATRAPDTTWTLRAQCRKGGTAFRERVQTAAVSEPRR